MLLNKTELKTSPIIREINIFDIYQIYQVLINIILILIFIYFKKKKNIINYNSLYYQDSV